MYVGAMETNFRAFFAFEQDAHLNLNSFTFAEMTSGAI
jgi:hypothetical protein